MTSPYDGVQWWEWTCTGVAQSWFAWDSAGGSWGRWSASTTTRSGLKQAGTGGNSRLVLVR